MERLRTFDAFWPFYLRQHAQPRTRALHFFGTSLVIVLGIAGVATGAPWLFWAMPLAGYLFAWIAHFAVERNRPATFTYPLWSLAADLRMWALWITGRIGPELDRAGVPRAGAAAAATDPP